MAYPKRTDKPLYRGLVTQLEGLRIPFRAAEDLADGPDLAQRYDVVIDAMFGFSFKGEPRPPFDAILEVSDARGPTPCWRLHACNMGPEPCKGTLSKARRCLKREVMGACPDAEARQQPAGAGIR